MRRGIIYDLTKAEIQAKIDAALKKERRAILKHINEVLQDMEDANYHSCSREYVEPIAVFVAERGQ